MTTHNNRKLYRSQSDRFLAGVCGGLAEYFDVDPILIRIAFVLFVGMGGMGVLAYIILAFIIPIKLDDAHVDGRSSDRVGEFVEEATEKTKEFLHDLGESIQEKRDKRANHVGGRNLIGAIIIGIGVMALLNQVFPSVWFRWHMIWPLGLVLVGFWIIKSRD